MNCPTCGEELVRPIQNDSDPQPWTFCTAERDHSFWVVDGRLVPMGDND